MSAEQKAGPPIPPGVMRPNADGITRVDSVELFAYSGPLPPPSVLKHYEEVLPGAAERIFAEFEQEAKHRRTVERKFAQSDALSQTLGTVSASFIGLTGVGGGLWLAYEGRSLGGLCAIFGTLASLVGVFVYRSKSDGHHDDRSDAE